MKRLIYISLITIFACIGIFFGYLLWPTGKVIPGITYHGKNLSGFTKEQVVEMIQQSVSSRQTISFATDNGTVTVLLSELGIVPQVDTISEEILQFGYSVAIPEYISRRFWSFWGYAPYDWPTYTVNDSMLKVFFSDLNANSLNSSVKPYLTVQDNTVQLHKGKPGKVVDEVATKANLIAALEDDSHPTVSVVYKTDDNHEVLAKELALMTSVLGNYTTYYNEGAVGRSHNIRIASRTISGTILQPGSTFSFNDVVGERTAEAGFDDAPVMMGGQLVPGIGGGICQVSSTIFNAALLSGMEIVDRTPHFAPVGYIPAGRDATVSYGYLDFAFKNPYQHPVYVLTSAENGEMSVWIIGRPEDKPQSVSISVGGAYTIPNEVIEKEDPNADKDVIEEDGHPGSGMTTTRTVVYHDGTTTSESFDSVYDPLRTVIVKGTKKKEEVTTDKDKDNKATIEKKQTQTAKKDKSQTKKKE